VNDILPVVLYPSSPYHFPDLRRSTVDVNYYHFSVTRASSTAIASWPMTSILTSAV